MNSEKEQKYWESVGLALSSHSFDRLNSAYWGLRSIHRPKPSVDDGDLPVIE